MTRGGSSAPDKARARAEALFTPRESLCGGGHPGQPAAAGAQPKVHYSGAIVLQPAAALDAFVRIAAAGNEFVYCEAPEPMPEAEGWRRAGELAQAGLIRTHQRRRQGGGWQYYSVRTARPLPRQQSPQDKVLADPATMIMYGELKRAARLELPCPSDSELQRKAGLSARHLASWRFSRLVDVALIKSVLVYDGGVPSRVVTIEPGKHAGGAADKFTKLPGKYAALQKAAGRDVK